ncbi:two-component system sensor kinase [Salmonella enterica subsp. arizonae]|uniref:Two-component system sensor kinase n=1 Tax=Salmonella enterica subsp. arizonae TaxID=59203 RepID=A0A379T852_SALER|nr:two-component system sensor kinase [Salmonella enterica subsp. arizonae]
MLCRKLYYNLSKSNWRRKRFRPLRSGGDENAELHASGYYALFVDTVPDDVKRLYTEAATSDFAALAQTAHRLKGVFAMLNLVPGKQLCETLEHRIREKDAPGIEKYISDIDAYVKSLL